MSESDEKPELGESRSIQTTRILVSAFSMIPVVGSVIQTVISETIPDIRSQRIEAFLQKIESRIDSDLLNVGLQKESGLDLFEEGMWQSARALGEDRKKYIANLVVVGLGELEEKYARVRHWLRILNLLGDEDISHLLEERTWQVMNSSSAGEERKERLNKLTEIERSRRSLLFSMGLMRSTGEYDAPDQIEGVSENGEEFLRYLDLIDGSEVQNGG